jgi:hypothetical protein
MKLLLSGLVVVNLLLFGWFRGWMAPFGGDGREPGRIDRQVRPDDLRIVPVPRAATAPAANAAGGAGRSGSAESTGAGSGGPGGGAVSAGALRQAGCAEIGPLSEADSVRVHTALDAVAAVELSITTQRSDEVTSWWVFVPPASGDAARRVAELRERGVGDTYVMPDGIWKGAISLGLFRQEELATTLQRSLAQKGVKGVRVSPRGPAPGRLTLQVQPVDDAVAAEILKLRAGWPEASVRTCVRRG